jgi:lipid A 3-O-deacylase
MAAFDCEGSNLLKRMIAVMSIVCGVSLAAAQCCPGPLKGHVTDEKGAPIANAAVSVHDCTTPPDQHRSQSGVTKADGAYLIEQPSWGPCTLTVARAGYVDYVKPNFHSTIDNYTTTDVTLRPSAAAIDVFVSPVSDAAKRNWNFGALVQGGVGLQERTDYSFLMAGGHVGKALTSELGTGMLKGDFEYSVEIFPLWQSYTPKLPKIICPFATANLSNCSAPTVTGGTYRGASITPIILRWNFTHGRKLMPWIQGAGGVLYTTRKYPPIASLNSLDPTQTGIQANTSVWNFTPQGGVGAHYFVKPRRSVDISANAVHISSASLGDKNPGVNVSMQFSVGYSWWK